MPQTQLEGNFSPFETAGQACVKGQRIPQSEIPSGIICLQGLQPTLVELGNEKPLCQTIFLFKSHFHRIDQSRYGNAWFQMLFVGLTTLVLLTLIFP